MNLRQLLLEFTKTLEGYSFETLAVRTRVENEINDAYLSYSLVETSVQFTQILNNDDFTPMAIHSQLELDKFILPNSLELSASSLNEFPQTYPFSRSVPLLYNAVRAFLEKVLEENINNTTSFSMVKATEKTMAKLKQTIIRHIKKCQINDLSTLLQAHINVQYLLKMPAVWESFLISRNVSQGRGCRADFDDVFNALVEQIKTCCRAKVEQLMSVTSNLNWLLRVTSKEPREWIVDLAAYLDALWGILASLPEEKRQAITMEAHRHIHSSILKILFSREVPKFNRNALLQLHTDMTYIIQRAKERDIPGERLYVQVMRVLNLFLADDMKDYYQRTYGDDSRISVQKRKLLHLLSKYDTDKKRLVPFVKYLHA